VLLDFFLVCFFSLIFLFASCGGLSWLHVSFVLHVTYTVSYRPFVCMLANSWIVWEIIMTFLLEQDVINSKSRTNSKTVAFRCAAAHGWWFHVSDVKIRYVVTAYRMDNALDCVSRTKNTKKPLLNFNFTWPCFCHKIYWVLFESNHRLLHQSSTNNTMLKSYAVMQNLTKTNFWTFSRYLLTGRHTAPKTQPWT